MLELEKRKPVWNALSEFYLDTELQESDFNRITEVFTKSGYTIKQLKEIDLYEVFPLLQVNLLSVAGEWAGFDEEWLYSNCEKNYKKRGNPIYKLVRRIKNKIHYWMREDYWKEIEKRMN